MASVLGFALSCVQETIEFSSDLILSVLDTCLTAVWGPSCEEEVKQWEAMEVVAVRAEIGEAETASPTPEGHGGIDGLEAFLGEREECWQVRSQRNGPAESDAYRKSGEFLLQFETVLEVDSSSIGGCQLTASPGLYFY
jgi:hypothetical protein